MISQLVSVVLNLPPLLYVTIALASLWYWTTRSHLPDNVPPFPCKPYPLVGHAPMMKSRPVEKCHEWRLSTGDIYSIYVCKQFTVVINSLELIKEAFVKQGDLFSDRTGGFYSEVMKKKCVGILSNSGPNWKEQRTVSMAIFKSLGVGKNVLAERISIETEAFLKVLSDLKGEATDIRLLTNASVSNVICAILYGRRYEFDDPYFVKMLKLMNEQIVLFRSVTLVTNYPWLRFLPGDFFSAKRLRDCVNEGFQFSEKIITKFLQEEGDKHENFITAYISEMKKRRESDTPTYLDEPSLLNVVSNLFIAGSETTGTTIIWAILFAILHPQIQEKVYKEIVDVVGSERVPSIHDKSRMNYTNAFIMETQRLGSIVPFSLFHMCNAETQLAGYTIPKDTLIIENLDEVLKDKETWGDPLVFRPERFLDPDNNLLVPEEFIPFSIGRRYCMGESLAKMELFIFVTGIFQRFQIMPEDPANLPSTDRVMGITCCPKPFKTRLIERRHQD